MSKIPQGEWNAIAARYQNGESISKIARSYDCTPPAIHYILKRNRQQPANAAPRPGVVQPAPAPQLVRTNAREPSPSSLAAEPPAGAFGNTPAGALSNAPAGGLSNAKAASMPLCARVDPLPRPREFNGQAAGSGSSRAAIPPAPPASVVPGLDSELHLRAEAAIELFRSSFDAARAEGSPGVCEKLRRAANDLMRVAARTTIVLDRLNAILERSGRAHNYPRSAHAGEDLGKLG
jgi:hypothetical protein